MPCGSRTTNAEPEPVSPAIVYPPSKSLHARFNTRWRLTSFSMNSEISWLVNLSLYRSKMACTSSSRKWPIFSITVTVSTFSFGCWPRFTKMSNSSSTLVMLKFPAITRLRLLQLFWRRKGWTFSMLFFPWVPYRKWPNHSSPVNATFSLSHRSSRVLCWLPLNDFLYFLLIFLKRWAMGVGFMER